MPYDGRMKMIHKLLDWVCGLSGALALFAIMALTFLDVGARKFLNNSIVGSLELTELLMVIVIFAALPLVVQRSEHVVFDSFDGFLPQWLRVMQNVLVHLLCGATMLGLTFLMWNMGLDIANQGETTAQLQWPKAPFIQVMAFMCGLTGVLHLGLMFAPPADQPEAENIPL
jgi:TRAP-type C4-dicarboxylate transport system permease small subunit